MKLVKGHHFARSGAGSGRGFNDPGIDHFKKSNSLWNETKQNVGDNKNEDNDDPAIIIYKQVDMDLSTFGIGKEFKEIFNAAYERCKIISDKEDAREFYKNGLRLLRKKMERRLDRMPPLRIFRQCLGTKQKRGLLL